MRQRVIHLDQHVIDLPGSSPEQLAATKPPETNIDRENADRIAALAWELQRRDLPSLQAAMHPRYNELSEQQRASCRASVTRTVQALVMLGWIDLPS